MLYQLAAPLFCLLVLLFLGNCNSSTQADLGRSNENAKIAKSGQASSDKENDDPMDPEEMDQEELPLAPLLPPTGAAPYGHSQLYGGSSSGKRNINRCACFEEGEDKECVKACECNEEEDNAC